MIPTFSLGKKEKKKKKKNSQFVKNEQFLPSFPLPPHFPFFQRSIPLTYFHARASPLFFLLFFARNETYCPTQVPMEKKKRQIALLISRCSHWSYGWKEIIGPGYTVDLIEECVIRNLEEDDLDLVFHRQNFFVYVALYSSRRLNLLKELWILCYVYIFLFFFFVCLMLSNVS